MGLYIEQVMNPGVHTMPSLVYALKHPTTLALLKNKSEQAQQR